MMRGEKIVGVDYKYKEKWTLFYPSLRPNTRLRKKRKVIQVVEAMGSREQPVEGPGELGQTAGLNEDVEQSSKWKKRERTRQGLVNGKKL